MIKEQMDLCGRMFRENGHQLSEFIKESETAILNHIVDSDRYRAKLIVSQHPCDKKRVIIDGHAVTVVFDGLNLAMAIGSRRTDLRHLTRYYDADRFLSALDLISHVGSVKFEAIEKLRETKRTLCIDLRFRMDLEELLKPTMEYLENRIKELSQ